MIGRRRDGRAHGRSGGRAQPTMGRMGGRRRSPGAARTARGPRPPRRGGPGPSATAGTAARPAAARDGRGRRAGRAARPAGPAAGLLLPAAVQRRPAAADRADHGLLGDQREGLRRGRQRLGLGDQAGHLRGDRHRRVLGLPAAARQHLPVAGPAAAVHLGGAAAGAQPAGGLRPADRPGGRIGPIEAQLHWLFIGGIQVQPSELAKFALVLWGAHVIARKGAALGWWRELATPLFPVVGLLFVLVGYNDLGTCSVCWPWWSACSGRPGCGCGSSAR